MFIKKIKDALRVRANNKRALKEMLRAKKEMALKRDEYLCLSYNKPDFWEKVIQKCNEDPNLSVTMTMLDGTRIVFQTHQAGKIKSKFTSTEY